MAQKKKKNTSRPHPKSQQSPSKKTVPQTTQKRERDPVMSRVFFNLFTAIACFGVAIYYYTKGESNTVLTMSLAGAAFLIVGGVHFYRSRKKK